MTDDEAARLRGLARAEHDALEAISDADPPVPRELRMNYDIAFDALTQEIDGETILKLLDERDALRRERDEMIAKAAAKSLDGYRELGARAAAAENERDAAMALLREAQHAIALAGYGSRMAPEVADTIRRIDAMLGGGEG